MDKAGQDEFSRRDFAALSVAAGVAGTAGAAEGAEVVETDVTITTADGSADAAFFHPAGKGSWPGVVIFTDVGGLRPAFRDMGRRLAALGYAVVVPNPFYRTKKAPVFEKPIDFNSAADRQLMADLRKPLTPDAGGRDALAYIAWLDGQKVVNKKKKVGVQGYCMGGSYTFAAAALNPARVGAAGSFHGGGLVTDAPTSPHLTIPKMKAELLVAIAQNDDAKQPDAKDKLKAAFAAAGRPATVEVYKADHGWCVPGGAVYNQAEAERAWAALMDIYRRRLG